MKTEWIYGAITAICLIAMGVLLGLLYESLFTKIPTNWPSPMDRISEDNITATTGGVCVKLPYKQIIIASLSDTRSMDPTFDAEANLIQFIPHNESEIQVGDIVAFNGSTTGFGNFSVVHRIVKIGKDKQGTYYVTQGDNLLFSDGKMRFKDIEEVVLGILY